MKSQIKIGKTLIHFKEIDSTNEYAKLHGQNLEEGTVIFSDVQTKGRGRLSREWESPVGGLWFSIVLKPAKINPLITLMSGVSVVRGLKKFGIKARLKWPNDVLFDKKKLCGILTEAKDFVVVGIGLNVNNEVPEGAISIGQILEKKISKVKVLKSILENFERLYLLLENGETKEILKLWRENSCTLGENVRVSVLDEVFEGRALGIDEDGSLILDVDGERRRISLGDVFFRVITLPPKTQSQR
ncbi:MAG: biotin--[acetyl-CoA-carboxylase] ligase [Candidatus Methanofastidiosia archaeon]